MHARVQILGRLAFMPEMRSTDDGRQYLKLRLAAHHRRQNKETEEWEEETSWFSIFLHGDRAERALRRFRKGDWIFVDGRLSVDDQGRCDIWPHEVKLVPTGKMDDAYVPSSATMPAEESDIPF